LPLRTKRHEVDLGFRGLANTARMLSPGKPSSLRWEALIFAALAAETVLLSLSARRGLLSVAFTCAEMLDTVRFLWDA